MKSQPVTTRNCSQVPEVPVERLIGVIECDHITGLALDINICLYYPDVAG